jgi:kynureninase
MRFLDHPEFADELDKEDPLASYRAQFHIPQHKGRDCIYLCGNSLGLQPKNAAPYVMEEMEDWQRLGVEGHVHARHPWMPYHEFLTEQMARVVGAKPIETVVMNSLTVNLHLMMASFYRPTKERYKILIESDAFPSDRYAVESQAKFHGVDPENAIITWKPRGGETLPRLDDLQVLLNKYGHQIALIMIGGVNYYTGQAFDMKAITEMGHKHGAVVGFDLAHGAGNIILNLHDWNVDFACWCTYKYLNSGPGGLSGVFVHERHARAFDLPRFTGWWGHNKESRFNMRDDFDPLPGAEGWQLSNPPILPMATLRASLELFDQVGMHKLREKSERLTGYLEFKVRQLGSEKVEIITPRKKEERGCQLSIRVKNADKNLYQNITSNGVIADWREPDVIRVAPVPFYNNFKDISHFTDIIKNEIIR